MVEVWKKILGEASLYVRILSRDQSWESRHRYTLLYYLREHVKMLQ
jgi:hypothetical protein